MAKILFCNYKFGSSIGHETGNDNFFVYPDGNCYGYVEVGGNTPKNYKKLWIEKIDGSAKRQESISDVTVVFCAKQAENTPTSICGWYLHATVYREIQGGKQDGYQPYYFMTAKDNVKFIPSGNRNFHFDRTKINLGRRIRYANEPSAQDVVKEVLDYIEKNP